LELSHVKFPSTQQQSGETTSVDAFFGVST